MSAAGELILSQIAAQRLPSPQTACAHSPPPSASQFENLGSRWIWTPEHYVSTQEPWALICYFDKPPLLWETYPQICFRGENQKQWSQLVMLGDDAWLRIGVHPKCFECCQPLYVDLSNVPTPNFENGFLFFVRGFVSWKPFLTTLKSHVRSLWCSRVLAQAMKSRPTWPQDDSVQVYHNVVQVNQDILKRKGLQ